MAEDLIGVAVVTGGGTGLGREIALGLARAGYGLLVADLDSRAAVECERMVSALGVPARSVAADVREPSGLKRIVRSAVAMGGPHVLVNNAGGWSPHRQYPDAPAPEWTATLALNLTAPMMLSQLVLEPMRALGGGAIVNIASSAGIGADPYGSPEYAAAKAGLIRFTTSMDSPGVRMTCVVPDWIGLSRAHAEWARMSPEQQAITPPLIPPADVVAVVLDLIRKGTGGTVVEMR